MRILLLTSRLPYPPYRGDKLKIFNLIKQLSKRGHEITLLSFISSKDELQYVTMLKEYCSEVKTIYLPVWKSILNCICNIPANKPFQVAYYKSKTFKRQIENEFESKQFDIVHVHLIRMAQYMKDFRIPRILDLTDAGSLYLERFLNTNKNIIYKLLLKTELTRLSKYEKILEYFNRCLVCSAVDKEFLLKNAPKAKIDLLYNGIDLDYFTNTQNVEREPNRIIFTGNMSYFPNSDGVHYFVKEIFPLIKKQIQDAKLYIVGKDPPPSILKLAQHDIIITGFVHDIKDYYLKSSVVIAPIRFGAGTLNKILEPMALGVPVVTSFIGVEGLPVETGRDILIADTPEDFANAVVKVLKDPDMQKRLSENAKNIVRSLYDWKIIAEQLESYYYENLGKHL